MMNKPNIKELPKEVQNDFTVASYYINQGNLEMGRRALRVIIEYHTEHNLEVCDEIQVLYGKLLGLEIISTKKGEASS
jgi:hypothetical protein